MANRCQNCGRLLIGRARDKLGNFCSIVCRDNFVHPGFCDACIATTTPVSSGGNSRVNGIGVWFYGARHRCNICGSVVQRQWFCVLFVPVFPGRSFRVKYVAPKRYLSRELRKQPKGTRNPPNKMAQPPPLPLNFCPRCGSSILAGANFCHACGAPVHKPPAT